jgi:hypothetical protein
VSEAQPAEGIALPAATILHLVDGIREIIRRHRLEVFNATARRCHCGAKELSDHPSHVAHEIVAGLGLRPEKSHVTDEIRYVSAWFDDELTKLEGSE